MLASDSPLSKIDNKILFNHIAYHKFLLSSFSNYNSSSRCGGEFHVLVHHPICYDKTTKFTNKIVVQTFFLLQKNLGIYIRLKREEPYQKQFQKKKEGKRRGKLITHYNQN